MQQISINPAFIPILGSVAAAIISGTVAFLVAVFTKENKTSEFRQAWIDSLRSDVSEFISMYQIIAVSFELARKRLKAGEQILENDIFQSVRNEIVKIEHSAARIELRLNPVEHKALIEKMNSLKSMENYLNHADRAPALNELKSCFQQVFKSEWRRVKRGEPIYQAVKWVSLFIVGISVISIFFLT